MFLYMVYMLEAKSYSQTDIFSELRLQRSKHGSNWGVSNRWNGIWNGTMEWKMEWNSKHTQL